MTDRTFLWVALLCYLVSCWLTLRRLRAGGASAFLHRMNLAAMVCGFAAHTAFLVLRGEAIHRCPLTNGMEMTVFIAWGTVLFYLLIGPAYRVSFLGAFTAPLAFSITLVALLGMRDVPAPEPLKRSPWVEFHAAIAVLACGAFALAAVVSAMYLLQERQLKTRRLTPSFLEFPSLQQLDSINFRLLILGVLMLTAGMLGGMVSYRIIGRWTVPKIIWSWIVWLTYGGLMVGRAVRALHGRKAALLVTLAFIFTIVTYWVLSLLQGFFTKAP